MSEGKEINIWEEVFSRMDELAIKLSDIGNKYGGDVVDLTLAVVRFEGIAHVGKGVALLGAAGSLAYVFKKFLKYYNKNETRHNDYVDGYVVIGMCGMIASGVGGCIAAVVSLVHLINPWKWIAIFEPKVALAKQIISSMIGM